ncbi:MAG: delta-60 repeat domain-containing protein, partial [Bacteroidales bacterium]|nr:delta-60 repeat domain-containing protein [Bacteroidales bacterium]
MKTAILSLSTAMLFTSAVFGQNSADRDTSFNVSGLGTTVFATGGQFSKVTALDGGKVLVTGSFYSAATTAPTYARILRLNNDGSFDNTFNLGGVGASGIIAATAVQADGKIIIGGNFPAYNGTTFGGIARINADGSIDNTFNPGTGFSSIIGQAVRNIAIQPDGKLIIGGGFTSFNGTAIAGVCRLNADGSLDNTFSPGSGPNNIV